MTVQRLETLTDDPELLLRDGVRKNFTSSHIAFVGDRELDEAVRLAIHTHAMKHPNEPALKPKSVEVRWADADKVVVTLGYTKRFGSETSAFPVSYQYPVQIKNQAKEVQGSYRQPTLPF